MITTLGTEQASGSNEPSFQVALTATFTAQPIRESLEFWMRELGFSVSLEFAPYSQVFQQLLDPASLLSRNHRGANVVLIRPEDWLRALPGLTTHSAGELQETLDRNAADLIDAVRGMADRSDIPIVVALCPNSAASRASCKHLDRISAKIAEELAQISGVSVIGSRDFELNPVAEPDDFRRDRLGHIPYTSEFFAALGTLLARRIHAQLAPPYKVVALDCDNTLWKGVVGEEGVHGIEIPPAWLALQRFLINLVDQGFLLCLCSKHVEADVMEVFDRRADMALKLEHLVSWRINWQPNSQNIRDLAQELSLGLDSFIFLDDNPVECAEVELNCPEVLTLRLPIDGDMERFLNHIWAIDRSRVTAEDRRRTPMYQEEAARARLQKEAPTFSEFLETLRLQVAIAAVSREQVGRIAQLTQRTNQFNFTTVRRTEGEIRQLRESGLESRTIVVADRFGDYGLVGVVVFGARDGTLEIDTFLLSCRVLGRGVEHRIMSELGGIAQARGLSHVIAPIIFTKKNQPAREFLEQIAGAYGRPRCQSPGERLVSDCVDPWAYSLRTTRVPRSLER